jgi:hypothetical protein
MANKRVNSGGGGWGLSIVYKRQTKPHKDALSLPKEHIRNILQLVISAVTCSSLELSKINKGNISPHWT